MRRRCLGRHHPPQPPRPRSLPPSSTSDVLAVEGDRLAGCRRAAFGECLINGEIYSPSVGIRTCLAVRKLSRSAAGRLAASVSRSVRGMWSCGTAAQGVLPGSALCEALLSLESVEEAVRRRDPGGRCSGHRWVEHPGRERLQRRGEDPQPHPSGVSTSAAPVSDRGRARRRIAAVPCQAWRCPRRALRRASPASWLRSGAVPAMRCAIVGSGRRESRRRTGKRL